MKIHEMNLQPKYFDFMKEGTKRIELRLFDEKRSQIELGDIIEFSILADVSMTKDELLGVLSEFYAPERQAEYGVIGIRLRALFC
jgi:ASC-1-like (ASCH) protein